MKLRCPRIGKCNVDVSFYHFITYCVGGQYHSCPYYLPFLTGEYRIRVKKPREWEHGNV